MLYQIVVLFCAVGAPTATCDETTALRVMRHQVSAPSPAHCGRMAMLAAAQHEALLPDGARARIICIPRTDGFEASVAQSEAVGR